MRKILSVWLSVGLSLALLSTVAFGEEQATGKDALEIEEIRVETPEEAVEETAEAIDETEEAIDEMAEGVEEPEETEGEEEPEGTEGTEEEKITSIDYMVLVNKLNPLPDGWEDVLETVHTTNSLGDDVEVEKKAYDAYLQLKAALEEEGVYVDLDSARRSVAEQQRIMDDFTETYGADYAMKTVATPGYSEHHTGLALDLYLVIDGEDVYLNEDMVEYPEIWAKIHEKLPAYGFILRYLEDKEYITGYGYEPWHIRYIDNPELAKEITEAGITLEGYLEGVTEEEPVEVDYGNSTLYSEEDLKEAAVQVKCRFASFEDCQLHTLRYAGDECVTEENLAWMKELGEEEDFVYVCEFSSDFHSPLEQKGAWQPDHEYEDWTWWLARTEEDGWQLLTWGY